MQRLRFLAHGPLTNAGLSKLCEAQPSPIPAAAPQERSPPRDVWGEVKKLPLHMDEPAAATSAIHALSNALHVDYLDPVSVAASEALACKVCCIWHEMRCKAHTLQEMKCKARR